MSNRKKSLKPVDPMGSVFTALSTASDALAEVQNAISSPRSMNMYQGDTSVTIPANAQITNSAIGYGSSNTSSTYMLQAAYPFPAYDTGGYPKVDIVQDTMPAPQKANSASPPYDVPAWRIDIFVAGVPKENVKIKMDEAVQFRSYHYQPTMTVTVDKVEQKVVEQGTYFLKESKYSSSQRLLTLPTDANVHQHTKPIFENGVLSFKIMRNETPLQPVATTVELDIT